jgi:microcystin-dependent protein
MTSSFKVSNDQNFTNITNVSSLSDSVTTNTLTINTMKAYEFNDTNDLNAVVYNTQTKDVNYKSFSLTPPGVISQYAGSSAPNGYLLCDGSAVSRSTYSQLFNVIGVLYGNGNGATTFNLPNLKGRIPVGFDSSQTEFDNLGEAGGSKTNTLSVNQLPSHNHTGTTDSDGLHNHTGTADSAGLHTHTSNAVGGQGNLGLVTANGVNTVVDTDSSNGELNVWTTPYALSIDNGGVHTHNLSINNNGTHTHTFTTNNTGGGQSVNNLQPYIVLNYIIKY